MPVLTRLRGKVFCGDALSLLRVIPDRAIDVCASDGMFGTARNCRYSWGIDPAQGDPIKHWKYHEATYRECLRVLKPGGVLAWAQGVKFLDHFQGWFGDHGKWTRIRIGGSSKTVSGHLWIVQTKERTALPDRGGVIKFDRLPPRHWHPCPKPVEELAWVLKRLVKPGQTVLDCFCGIGSTLLAAEQSQCDWIGCDLGPDYCRTAKYRMAQFRKCGLTL